MNQLDVHQCPQKNDPLFPEQVNLKIDELFSNVMLSPDGRISVHI